MASDVPYQLVENLLQELFFESVWWLKTEEIFPWWFGILECLSDGGFSGTETLLNWIELFIRLEVQKINIQFEIQLYSAIYK